MPIMSAARADSSPSHHEGNGQSATQKFRVVSGSFRYARRYRNTLNEQGRKLDALQTTVTDGFAQILRRLDGFAATPSYPSQDTKSAGHGCVGRGVSFVVGWDRWDDRGELVV